jgi:hypothetical protein
MLLLLQRLLKQASQGIWAQTRIRPSVSPWFGSRCCSEKSVQRDSWLSILKAHELDAKIYVKVTLHRLFLSQTGVHQDRTRHHS